MENGSDTQSSKKKVTKICVTVLGVLLGLAAPPVVFLWAFRWMFALFLWWTADYRIGGAHLYLAVLGGMSLGIAWSVFAFAGWKRGNIGIRVGLSVVIWTLIAAVVGVFWLRGFIEAL